MTECQWILIVTRNGSNKSCREHQNTHNIFQNVFPESSAFMRQRANTRIWYSHTGHRKSNIIRRMRFTSWATEAKYTHTQNI